MQRGIEKTNCRWRAFQRRKDADEISPLIRQELGQRSLSFFLRPGENHLPHGIDAIAFEKHVLRSANSDAFRAKRDRVCDLLWRVRVRAHPESPELIRPAH